MNEIEKWFVTIASVVAFYGLYTLAIAAAYGVFWTLSLFMPQYIALAILLGAIVSYQVYRIKRSVDERAAKIK